MADISCHHQIGTFLLKAAEKAGLQACGKKIANHSVWKTSISRLLDGGTPENFVAQLSGHKKYAKFELIQVCFHNTPAKNVRHLTANKLLDLV